jgi:archaemetzincin
VSILVSWIGEGAEPHGLIGEAIRVLGREYARRAARVAIDGRPEGTYDVARRQHSSRVMLAWLATLAGSAEAGRHHWHGGGPAEAGRHDDYGIKLLGVTDVDLYIPVLTFVFGEAQLGRQTAVVSIARLREGGIAAQVAARLVKEAVHEVGHTFGLVHCTSPSCVMARSAGLAAVDRKTDRLCADCRIRYQELREQPHVSARTPHSDR